MNTKVKYLELNTGYIESHSLATLTLYHQAGGFDTVQEALENLARIFLRAAKRDRDTERCILNYPKSACCLKSFDNGDKVCATCNKHIPYLAKLDTDSLETLFLEYFSGTIDSDYTFVEELWELDNWTLWPDNRSDRFTHTQDDEDELVEAFRNRVSLDSAERIIASFAMRQLECDETAVVLNEHEDYDENWWTQHIDCANKDTKKVKDNA